MPLATTTDTAAAPKIALSKYEIQRNERHAASQAGSNAKRRGRNAPRRDDMARAAYYALLMYYQEARTEQDKAAFKRPLVNMLAKAGYPREICATLFDSHLASLMNDLDGWLAQRWYAEGSRLKDDRGRYEPLDRGDPKVSQVGSQALTSFLERPADGSAAD